MSFIIETFYIFMHYLFICEKSRHVFFILIRYAQSPHILAHLLLYTIHTYIYLYFIFHTFSVLKNSIHTQHEAFLGSLCLLFLCTFKYIYKPGGTMAGLMGRWSSRFDRKGSDDQGRWSWLTFNDKGSKKILFVSAYWVCQDSLITADYGFAFM